MHPMSVVFPVGLLLASATAVAIPQYFAPPQNCSCYTAVEYKIKERFACPEPAQADGMMCPEIECARDNIHTETIPPPHESCPTTSTMTVEQGCQTTCPGCFTSTVTETGCPTATETVMGGPIECAMCEGVERRAFVTPAPPSPEPPSPHRPAPQCGCGNQPTTTITVKPTCPPCTPLTPIEPTPESGSMVTAFI